MSRAFSWSIGWMVVFFAWSAAHAIDCTHPEGGVPLSLYGDLNQSGSVNVADAMCSVVYTLTQQAGQPAPSCLLEPGVAADVGCDGSRDIADTLLIINLAIAGQVPSALNPDGSGCPAACAPCNGGGLSCLIDSVCRAEGERSGADGCQVCAATTAPTAWTTETAEPWYLDEDDDGFGVSGDSQMACVAMGNYRTTVAGDCNDASDAAFPGADELCDGIDNNCDMVTDEGCSSGTDNPLDAVAGTAAAFSTRRLSSVYTGPCLRVRRTSDNAETNIGFTPAGNLDTATLLTFCGTSTCAVAVWYDQSGNARDFSQTTPALQPVLVDAGTLQTEGGRPSVRMQAQWMSTALADWGTEFSVFLVHGLLDGGWGAVTGPPYQRIIETDYQTHFYLGSNSDSTAYQAIVNNPASPYGSLIGGDEQPGVLRQISSVTGSGLLDFQMDGDLIGSININVVSSPNYPLYLNRYFANANYMVNGYYSEIIWVNSALSAANREAIEASQVCYFGLDPTEYDGNGNGIADACEVSVADDCTAHRDAGATDSGPYLIDPDGVGGDAPYTVYCDMSTAGGGWTLAMNLDTSDGHVMWWANSLWTNGSAYGSATDPFATDHVSEAWSNLDGGTQLLLTVHDNGTLLGWKRFEKVNGSTLLSHMNSGDNTLIGSPVVDSFLAPGLWAQETLVRSSTSLYANHCVNGSCTTGSGGSPDGHRIGSNEAAPGNNDGGGLGDWSDMGYCCSGQSYGSGKSCNGQSFRTTSEAQVGWCPGYPGTRNHGYFGTDTFGTATCTFTNNNCNNADWAGHSGFDYDYSLYIGHQPLEGSSSANPGVTCATILAAGASVGDGVYWVDPSGSDPFQVYCDMTTDGGGWSLMAVGSTFSAANDVTNITSDAASPTRVLQQSRAEALTGAATTTYRVSNSDRSQSLFIDDSAALFSSAAGFGYGRGHVWTSDGPTVSCSTDYADVVAGTMTDASAFSINCDPKAIGSHTCGVTSGWILLHSGGTYNQSGGHPCPFGAGQSTGLVYRWVR